MNKHVLTLTTLAVIAASSLFAGSAQAQYGARQYYGNWQSHSSGYAYRAYYYKPTPDYSAYKHHYVIYDYKKDPQHEYYYNPYSKKYWGRCPVSYGDKPVYSMLAEKDRQGDLDKIAPTAFPA